jgi:hypothetical protein
VSAPLLTRVHFRCALWWQARAMPLRVHRRPLNAVLTRANATPVARYRDLPVAYIVKRVGRTVRRPWLMRDRRCLREGLLAFRFLQAAGYEPELHFGIDRSSFPGPGLKAHCWVVNRGEIVMNRDERMVPIYVHRASQPVTAPMGQLAQATFT